MNQIALVQPRILVCLGRVAAKRLIDENFRVTTQHGQWFEKNGIQYMGTYHPSALLRDGQKRPDAFADLLEIRKKIAELGSKLN